MANQNQINLFNLLANFSHGVVLELVSNAYKLFGSTVCSGDALPQLLLPIAEGYFNDCVHAIESREDAYINKQFDAMRAIELEGKNHPMDLLQLIVTLSLNCIHNMEISEIMSGNYEISMEAVGVHLRAILKRFEPLACELRGCTPGHIHETIQPGEKIFTFTLDKYVQTEQGPVKLTRLEF